MEALVLIYRLVAVAIVAYWIRQIAVTLRRPSDWRPPYNSPFPLTRERWLLAGVFGVIAGLAVLAFSFVLFEV